jgi:homeobox-leucine zipper protein
MCRTKLKQTEMEGEYLKRCFGSLTEENRRLQRVVEELRAMRVAPPTRQPLPASALTMCPRCERITAATGPPAAARTARPPPAPSSFHPWLPSAVF